MPQQTFVEIAANYRNEPIVTDLVMSQVEQFSSAATVNDDPSGPFTWHLSDGRKADKMTIKNYLDY